MHGLRRALVTGGGLLALLSVAGSGRAQRKCGAAGDLVVHALEQMTPASTPAQIDSAGSLLKRATGMCGELADAWYYRSLLDRRAGKAQTADTYLEHATTFNSEAAAEKRDPFVLAVPKGREVAPNSPVRERWALVVGVAEFQDQEIGDLQYTGEDAKSFADALRDPGVGHFKPENVRVLTNKDATRKAIKVGLNWLARSARPEDLVVIYIATHGSPSKEDTAGVNYVLPFDAEWGASHDKDLLFATALPMVEISDTVTSRIQAARTAIFLDTCYSQAAIGNTGAAAGTGVAANTGAKAVSAATLEHLQQSGGRIIFAASRSDQESQESKTLGHGYFTYYLVKALREKGGAMPLSQVYSYVQTHVSSDVARDYQRYALHQDPVMSRSGAETDFSLGEAAAVARDGALGHTSSAGTR